jgi:ABC-type polysaccharide/polyol phosphate export permease
MIADVGLLAGFFLTPIFYPMSTLPRSYVLFGIDWDVWQMMYYLNPMASIIANYRVIIFDGAPPALDFLGRTLATSAIFMLLGLTIFHIYKGRFSEEI